MQKHSSYTWQEWVGEEIRKKYQKAIIAIAGVVEVKNCFEKIVEINPRLRQRTYRTW